LTGLMAFFPITLGRHSSRRALSWWLLPKKKPKNPGM
jgi:hypothetical protein